MKPSIRTYTVLLFIGLAGTVGGNALATWVLHSTSHYAIPSLYFVPLWIVVVIAAVKVGFKEGWNAAVSLHEDQK